MNLVVTMLLSLRRDVDALMEKHTNEIPVGGKIKRVSRAEQLQMARLYQAKTSMAEISRRFKVSHQTVKNQLEKAGAL